MGSSLFAAHAAADYLNHHGIKAFCWDANELVGTGLASVDAATLLIAISQSGASPETLAAAHIACQKARPLITLTNKKDSDLAKIKAIQCLMCAGEEENTTTKTYTNTLALAWIIAVTLCGSHFNKESLKRIAIQMGEMVQESLDSDLKTFVHALEFIAIIGSGASYATASQGQLLFEEAARTNAARYTTGQFIHGPIERIDEKYKVVLIDTIPAYRDKCDIIIQEVVKYRGQVLHISNRALPVENGSVFGYPLGLHEPALSPLLEIIPLEKIVIEIGHQNHFVAGLLRRTLKDLSERTGSQEL